MDKEKLNVINPEGKLSSNLVRDFSDTMWYSGKVVGKVSGRFFIKGLPFFKQMLCGVHTEEGFCVINSSVLTRESKFQIGLCNHDDKLPHEIKKINEHKESLIQQTTLYKGKSLTISQIVGILKQLAAILNDSHHIDVTFYIG